MEEPRSSFAFVQFGEFSHTNKNMLEQLHRQFPRMRCEVIDLADSRLVRRSRAPRLMFELAREHGPGALARPGAFHTRIMQTRYFFRAARRALLERLSGKGHSFVVQTQSLFDASVPGVANFVYTDHTHLSNLEYPGWNRAALAPQAWIDLERSVYRHARMVFTMSSNVSRTLIERYGCEPERVKCIYVGSNARSATQVDFSEARYARKKILFVGIDWERKGGPVLLQAFERVKQSHPDAELIIVGAAPQVRIDSVRVVGKVPVEKVADFYREASIFCMPTLVEPFGIAFIEAFAHGLPVIATRIGAIPDFVEPERSGYLVEPNDAAAVAQRLEDLLDDPQRCARFARHGKALVDERYDWDGTGERMAAHIRGALAADKAPPEARA